ncbi:MAG: bacillithiol biosynthesis cysteine-adding enzyme BshC [Planctomycetes bacterium]|nr:bacillithiol biosynthesis cysteine-adding enzyme BshC [Planctomycetota bacterium]
MPRIEHLAADVFGLSELSRAALSGRLAVPGLRVARRLADVTPPDDLWVPEERAHLARWLESRLAVYEPPVAVLDAVRRIAEPGACFVVTGQQPGLFTAPLYTLWKAVQACVLARELSAAWRRPVIPLFWNHADDHDVAEVHHGYFVNPNFDLQKVVLAGLSSGRAPLSTIALGEQHGLAAIAAMLRQIYGYLPHIDEALVRCVPRAGETFATAFTRTLLGLCGSLGLVVLEPDWLREDLSHHLAALVGEDLVGALARGETALAAAGFTPPLVSAEAALVYRVDAGGRTALRAGGDGYAYDDEPGSRTRAELAAEIVQEPRGYSPGALLRPLVQDLALPVAAYVGGPGELAYHAQLAGARAALALPAPAFVPRVSLTLVDGECERSLQKLEVAALEVLRARGAYDGPPGARAATTHGDAVRALAERTRRELLDSRAEIAAVDPNLSGLVKRTAEKVEEALAKLGDKIARVEANKGGKGRRHLRRLNQWLCPRGEAQERVLGPLYFVAAYGRDWIGELARELDPFTAEHLVVHLEPHDPAT